MLWPISWAKIAFTALGDTSCNKVGVNITYRKGAHIPIIAAVIESWIIFQVFKPAHLNLACWQRVTNSLSSNISQRYLTVKDWINKLQTSEKQTFLARFCTQEINADKLFHMLNYVNDLGLDIFTLHKFNNAIPEITNIDTFVQNERNVMHYGPIIQTTLCNLFKEIHA